MKRTYYLTVAFGAIAVALLIYTGRGVNPAGLAPAPAALASDKVLSEWLADPDQALGMAKSANKDILIEFDGPGSAGDPKAFHAAVFDTAEFRRRAGQQFVLVRLVSSADVAPERATQVATWAQRMGVRDFPTLALLDVQNRPYAAAVSQSRDTGETIKLLDRLARVRIERDESFAQAKRAEGIERARHLDDALQRVGAFAGEAYIDVMRQILALDAGNSAGIRAKYQYIVSDIDINHAIQVEVYPLIDKGNLIAAMQRIDRLTVEAGASPEQRQLLLAFKGQLYFSLHDTTNAVKSFDDAIRIAPHSDAAAKVLAAKAQVIGSP